MSNATEVFHQLNAELRSQNGEHHPFVDTLSLQMRLADQVQSLLSESQQCITLPPELEGDYTLTKRPRPPSSTGEVFFIERAGQTPLTVKLLAKLGQDWQLQTNHDPVYAFEHPEVRVMTALGESLMGKVANANAAHPLYHGICGVEQVSADGVVLRQFSLTDVLAGKMEPAVIMHQMDMSLADMLLDIRMARSQNRQPTVGGEKLSSWTQQSFQHILNASVPLPEDLAAQIGSPEEIQRLLLEKSMGWLMSRDQEQAVQKDQMLVDAVRLSKRTIHEYFSRFLKLSETQDQLIRRAVPQIGQGEKARLVQTFSPGDTKFANVMVGKNGSREDIVGLFDPQWLVIRDGALGNSGHIFAPWPFADLMQIAAYNAAQPAAYGFPQLQQVTYDALRQYYGEHWSEWHELYLRMLTAYKLLVEVSVTIDPYLDKKRSKEPIPPSMQMTLREYPKNAYHIARLGFHVYDGGQKKR